MKKAALPLLVGCLLLPTAHTQRSTSGTEKVAPLPALQQLVNNYAQKYGYERCDFLREDFAGTRYTETMNYTAEEWYAYHLRMLGGISHIAMLRASPEEHERLEQETQQTRERFIQNAVLNKEANVMTLFHEKGFSGSPQMHVFTQDAVGSLSLACALQPQP